MMQTFLIIYQRRIDIFLYHKYARKKKKMSNYCTRYCAKPRIQIQVLSNFKVYGISVVYSAAWFQVNLAHSSRAFFNLMTDFSSAEELNRVQNKGNCFPEFTCSFHGGFLPLPSPGNSG